MTKEQIFKLIDEKVLGLRNKAIIKDAIEDLVLNYKQKGIKPKFPSNYSGIWPKMVNQNKKVK